MDDKPLRSRDDLPPCDVTGCERTGTYFYRCSAVITARLCSPSRHPLEHEEAMSEQRGYFNEMLGDAEGTNLSDFDDGNRAQRDEATEDKCERIQRADDRELYGRRGR